MSAYRLEDHAGDARLELQAASLEELFRSAAEALLDLMTDPATVGEGSRRSIRVEADDTPSLLVSWLNELLFLFETEGLLLKRFELHIAHGRRLTAEARGEAFDPGRHPVEAVVKAATYHRLGLHGQPGDWRATVVLDL